MWFQAVYLTENAATNVPIYMVLYDKIQKVITAHHDKERGLDYLKEYLWIIADIVVLWQGVVPIVGRNPAQTSLNCKPAAANLSSIWDLMALRGWKDCLYVEYRPVEKA
jgi:hypothetical protein